MHLDIFLLLEIMTVFLMEIGNLTFYECSLNYKYGACPKIKPQCSIVKELFAHENCRINNIVGLFSKVTMEFK